MKNTYETYVENLCKNCKNKDTDLCDIRKTYKGTVRCVYYERENKQEGYKNQIKMTITAKRNKPIMEGLV